MTKRAIAVAFNIEISFNGSVVIRVFAQTGVLTVSALPYNTRRGCISQVNSLRATP